MHTEDEVSLNPVSAPFVPAPWRAFDVNVSARPHVDGLKHRLLGSPQSVHDSLRDVRVTDALSPEWTKPALRRPFDRFRSIGDGYAPLSLSLETSTVGQPRFCYFFLRLHFYTITWF